MYLFDGCMPPPLISSTKSFFYLLSLLCSIEFWRDFYELLVMFLLNILIYIIKRNQTICNKFHSSIKDKLLSKFTVFSDKNIILSLLSVSVCKSQAKFHQSDDMISLEVVFFDWKRPLFHICIIGIAQTIFNRILEK